MNTAEKRQQRIHERRRNARSGFPTRDQSISLLLKLESNIYTVSSMRDVSISGVGIETRLDQNLQTGMKIALEYTSKDFTLTIDGTVIWCKREQDDACHIGVEFDPKNRENNFLFFLALRKYLDEFDGAYLDA